MRFYLALAFLALLAFACGGGDAPVPSLDTQSPTTHQLTISEATVAVGEVVTVADEAGAFTEESYAAKLGAQALTLQRLDKRTLAFVVPAAALPGAAELAVTVPGTSYAPLALTVEAAPAVADPAKTVGDLATDYRAYVAEKKAGTTDPKILGWATALEANIQFMEDTFAGLDPAGQLQMAQFIAANTAAFAMMGTKSGLWDRAARVVNTGAKMAFFGAALALTWEVPPLAVAAAVGFGKSAVDFGEAVSDLYTESPIPAALESVTVDVEPVRARSIGVTHNAMFVLALTGDARTIGEAELTCERPDSELGAAAVAIDGGGETWAASNEHMHAPMEPVPVLEAKATMDASIPTDFFSIDPASVSNADVTLVSQATLGDAFTVTFQSALCDMDPPPSEPIAFTFEMAYDDGCHPAETLTVDATLACEVTCTGGELLSASDCSYSPQICGDGTTKSVSCTPEFNVNPYWMCTCTLNGVAGAACPHSSSVCPDFSEVGCGPFCP